ncbi:MAG: malonyl-CoA decarboxylase [Betaproteobacteria bacterium]|nr:malonyl-CoA decarboxylase [Betaproteobacteria bacterium]
MVPDSDIPAPAAPATGSGGATRLRRLWQRLTRRRGAEARGVEFSAREMRKLRATLEECAQGVGGEVSARQRAATLAQAYRSMAEQSRRTFLTLLNSDFGPDQRRLHEAIQGFLAASDDPARRRAELALKQALQTPRARILTQFNSLPDGVKFLVDMRSDLLRLLPQYPEIEALEDELYALLASWFDVGFLELRRITWNSPASLLEKLIAYEAVHEIRSWSDLRNRLDSDRRCYAFFHPRMPDEPLIFVEVALARSMAAGIQELLDEASPTFDTQDATTANFYSISNTQPGLRGVSFGGFLIKRVVDQLLQELPRLKTFATLSPLPQFRRWLDERLAQKDASLFGPGSRAKLTAAAQSREPWETLVRLLADDEWHAKPALASVLHPVLLHLAARYVVLEKTEGHPYDPVARFHLNNGARLERINWLADTSPRGMRHAAGIMVNYLYEIGDIEKNHEDYARDGQVIVSAAVRRLLKKPG